MLIDGLNLVAGSAANNLTIESGDATAQGLETPIAGSVFYRSDISELQLHDGSTWAAIGGGGGVSNPLVIGVEDTTAGVVDIHGDGTGSTVGGQINLHFAADNDTAYNGWQMRARGTDFAMEPIGAGFDFLRLNQSGTEFTIGNLIKSSGGYSFNGSANQLLNMKGQKMNFGGSTSAPDFFFDFGDVSGSNQDLGRMGSSHDGSSEMTSAIRFMGGTDTVNQSDGHIAFDTSPSGSFPSPTERMRLNNDGGLTIGSPTGSSQGAGTINATGLYVDGVAVGGSSGQTFVAGGAISAGVSAVSLPFTAIPAGASEVIVSLVGADISGTDDLILRIGNNTVGIVTSGYESNNTKFSGTSLSVSNNTTGLVLAATPGGTETFTGQIRIQKLSTSTATYSMTGNIGTATTVSYMVAGAVGLASDLTTIELGTSGTNTFSGGSFSVWYI